MYGAGQRPPSKISGARSASTIGATGRNCSRPLTSLSRSRFARVARVGEQGAVAERARAELAAALEPGDDAVGGEHLGDRVGEVVRALVDDAAAVEPGGQLVVVPAAAERGGAPSARPASPSSRGDVQRRAERGARRRPPRAAPRLVERALAPAAASWRRSSARRRRPSPGRARRSARAASRRARAAPPRAARWTLAARSAWRGSQLLAVGAAPARSAAQSTGSRAEAAVAVGVDELARSSSR